MSRKWVAFALALTVIFSLLAGCSSAGSKGGFKVGMSTDIGGLNDDSFNASAWRGLNKAHSDLGAEIKAVESKRNEDYEVNFRTLMDLKYDLIWGIGFLMHDAVDGLAKANPNQKFAIIDSVVENRPNVASVVFKEEEGSFLMGVMAAKTTKSKVVGFVGGMDFDVIHHFEGGFKAGVKAVDPSIKVITVYSGKFDDPVKGKSDALSIISQGADVIFHAAGFTGKGVIEACAEKKVFAIGVDSDQNALAPDWVISSMMKQVDNAVFSVSKAAKEGKFQGGQVVVMGLKEGGVGYAPKTLWAKMPSDTKALVDKWADAIKGGKVTVPNDAKKFESWSVPKI
ncbi:MAG TPA: BMP family ABC transporter substrate-binding protein [Symbiobacteriaceae bacterium]